MSEDGATENPPGESLWNARQRRALDSCCSVLRQRYPSYSTPACCRQPQIASFALLELFQTMLQLLSERRLNSFAFNLRPKFLLWL